VGAIGVVGKKSGFPLRAAHASYRPDSAIQPERVSLLFLGVYAVSPILQTGIRFVAILEVEWSTLTLLESTPGWVKIATLFLCVAVLGVLEFQAWFSNCGKWVFSGTLSALIVVYVALCAIGYLLLPSNTFSFEASVPCRQSTV
jgi:hypothetical protein